MKPAAQQCSPSPDDAGDGDVESEIPSFEKIRDMERHLLEACPVTARQAFARFLQMAPSLPHTREMILFQRAVDASDFSVSDWAAAAAVFQEWLEAKRRVTSFSKKIGYLACCAESVMAASPALRPSLAAQVTVMLDEYGFLG